MKRRGFIGSLLALLGLSSVNGSQAVEPSRMVKMNTGPEAPVERRSFRSYCMKLMEDAIKQKREVGPNQEQSWEEFIAFGEDELQRSGEVAIYIHPSALPYFCVTPVKRTVYKPGYFFGFTPPPPGPYWAVANVWDHAGNGLVWSLAEEEFVKKFDH